MLLQYSICTVSSKMAFWSFARYSRYCWRDQGFFSWAVQWWQSPESSRPSQTDRTLSTVLFVPTAIDKMLCPTGSSYRFLFLDTHGSERASAHHPSTPHPESTCKLHFLCSLYQRSKHIPVLPTLTPSLVSSGPSCLFLNTVRRDCGKSDPSTSKKFLTCPVSR